MSTKMGGKCNGGFTKCLGYFLHGRTNCAEINQLTGIHERTVRQYLKDYQNEKPVEEVGRIGRSPIVTAPGKVRIAQIVRHNPSISSEKIAEKVKIDHGEHDKRKHSPEKTNWDEIQGQKAEECSGPQRGP